MEETQSAVKVTYTCLISLVELAACTHVNCNKWQWQCTNKACGAIVLSLVCTPVFFPENVLAPNPMQTILLTCDSYLSSTSLKQKKFYLHLLASDGLSPKKCYSGEPLSSQRQYTDNSSMTTMSVYSSTMILRQVALWRHFSKHSPTNEFHNSYMWSIHSIFPGLVKKFFKASPPQGTTNATNFLKLVVSGMCCLARKCAQWRKGLHSSSISLLLFFCYCLKLLNNWSHLLASLMHYSFLSGQNVCITFGMCSHLFNGFLPIAERFCCPESTSFPRWPFRYLTESTECTITIGIIFQPSEFLFPFL